MADRLVQVYVPVSRSEQLREVAQRAHVVEVAHHPLGKRALHSYLVRAVEVEAFLDPLQTALADSEDFRIIMQPVVAALPRPERRTLQALAEAQRERPAKTSHRIARAELYEELSRSANLDPVFVATVVLSTLVAAIGLAGGNAAVVIAAMVIAPLLGPNMSLSLAATLGDGPLARRSFRTLGTGVAVAFVVSVVVGLFWPVDPASPEVAARTSIGVTDLALALLSGTAGALAFTSGVSASLVGVMVAVALLPPLVVFATLLVGGHSDEALGALLLLVANVICVNLSSVATFIVQGVRPRTWWEAARSGRAARIALALWLALLVAVTLIVVFARQRS